METVIETTTARYMNRIARKKICSGFLCLKKRIKQIRYKISPTAIAMSIELPNKEENDIVFRILDMLIPLFV